MSDKFAKAHLSRAMGLAEVSRANVEDTLLVARPEQMELRSRKVHTYLKPTEYDAFVRHIGRETLSNALRDLVLDFNRRQDLRDGSTS